jgi:hypothetical protein
LGDLGIDRSMLKMDIQEKKCKCMDLIQLALWQALVKALMNF